MDSSANTSHSGNTPTLGHKTGENKRKLKREKQAHHQIHSSLFHLLSLSMMDKKLAFSPTTIPLPPLFGASLLCGSVVIENNSSALVSTFHSFPISIPSFKNFMGIPMMVGGETIGMLGLANAKTNLWSHEQATLLLPFASLLAGILLLGDIGGGGGAGGALKSGFVDDLETCPTDLVTFTGGDHFLSASTNQQNRKLLLPGKRGRSLRETPSLLSCSVFPSFSQSTFRISKTSPTDSSESSSPVGFSEITQAKGRVKRRALSWNSLFTKKMAAMGNAMGHVLESLSEGIVVFDVHHVVVTCNAAAASMLQFEDRAHLMTHFTKIDKLIRPVCRVQGGEESGSKPNWTLEMKNLLEEVDGGETVRFEAQLNVHSSKEKEEGEGGGGGGRMERENGEEFVFVDLVLTTFWFQGERYYSAVFRDMTQDKVFQEKDVLLAFLSHEIRNPVQAIISGAEELQNGTGEEFDREVARDVFAAADLLHAVVNETIDFVQISSRNFVAKPEVFFFFFLFFFFFFFFLFFFFFFFSLF